MTNARPQAHDVWRLAFEYEDQPGVRKERPVVIGAVDDKNAMVLVVKVTSHEPRNGFPGEVVLKDWKEAGLEKPSTARCSKTLIVPVEIFSELHRYGRLSEDDAESVSKTLKSLNKIL